VRPHLGDVIVATGQKPRNGDEAQMALEHCATLADYTTPNSPGSLARAPWVRHLWVPERIRRSHRIMRSRPRAEIGTLILCCFHHMGILPRGVLIYYLDDHGFLFFYFFLFWLVLLSPSLKRRRVRFLLNIYRSESLLFCLVIL